MPYIDQYTTSAGDAWDLIAYKVYGDEKFMTALLRANPDYRETAIFEAGVQLVCPDIDVAEASTAPPWRD